MLDRIMGVWTLKSPTYKSIAEDKSATTNAAIIVAIAALLGGIGLGLGGSSKSMVGAIVSTLVAALIGWVVGSWLLAFIAKTVFKGTTDTGEMMRVNGFVQSFGFLNVLAAIPFLGPIIGLVVLVLSIIGNIIGIREAAGFDTTKAVLTSLIAMVATFFVVALITAPIALMFAQ